MRRPCPCLMAAQPHPDEQRNATVGRAAMDTLAGADPRCPGPHPDEYPHPRQKGG
jgi:hypothetical protein